ncbi:molybdopterin-dependent oxidoreductase [Octadecabacter sp. 1_MG-2023]|uniref:molybdopterin-dependent oxidoreductase n=1 Tax=unclassified Octadecabacter TaxID=196158 RepID=UPI001C09A88D|nr:MULTISPECIES: molybdopterin-dependent oxidoreductase [unclassified Octadecabacter]MBU2994501.1 molybdopterin-dependent oxidoreductase [Octadecabacter sp. B2R22]MDO6734206.1 molybdopterin-dependent oxidoreductase [Octadecabacter sp. 1_MG-2023]
MFTRVFAFASAAVVALVMAGAARADDVPPPNGDVILTVTGTVQSSDEALNREFDYESLSALGLDRIDTSTIWTDGVQTFEGVSLKSFIDSLGIEDGTLFATAINDYTVEIPVSDAVENGPIIAFVMNGERMTVRDKGPLWIIYPYDASSSYRTEVIYSRSIWQLDRIEVVE